MKKQLLTLLLICSLLLLSGCNFLTPVTPDQPETVTIDPHKFVDEFQSNWQYNALSDENKRLYGTLYTAVKEAENQNAVISFTGEHGTTESHPGVRVTFPNAALTATQFSMLYEAFFRDNPQFFYVSRTYHLEGRSTANQQDPLYDTLLVEFTLPLPQRLAAIQQLQAATASILADCPNDSDDYVKELYLHDRLVQGCIYDKNPTDTNNSIYTAYGALVEGKAVCEGYAKAMQLLLNQAHIPATVVSGHSLDNGEAHMWNLVSINGSTYFLDPTWNDSETYIQHTYFNLTSNMMKSSHKLDDHQLVMTECTATEANFFIRNNAYIDTYERLSIAQVIAQQILDGRQVVQLRFAPEKFTNGQLFLKNRTLLQQMVNPYLSSAGMTLWSYQLWAEEEQSVLTLVKE